MINTIRTAKTIMKDAPDTIFVIDQKRCTWCGGCASVCPVCAIDMHARRSAITSPCSGCGACFAFCPVGAIVKNAGPAHET